VEDVFGGKWSGVALTLALVLAVTLVIPTAAAQAADLAVPGQYATIQAAVDAAMNGDTIIVQTGTYNPFTVDGKTLTIQGAGYPVVTGTMDVATDFVGTTSAIVFLNQAHVTMTGLHIIGSAAGSEATIAKTALYGIIAQESDLVFSDGLLDNSSPQGPVILSWSKPDDGNRPMLRVERSKPEWYATGLVLVRGDIHAEILNNDFGHACGGVDFEDQVSGSITGNMSEGEGCTAIGVNSSGDVEISENTIRKAYDAGIYIGGTGQIAIVNNTIEGTYRGGGIHVAGRPGLVLHAEGNTVSGNTIGILLQDVGEARISITGNKILGNGCGLYASNAASAAADVAGNEIRGNGVGVFISDVVVVLPSTETVALHNNNIAENGQGVNATKSHYPIDATANWWGDPTGPSGAGSGSGDKIVGNVTFSPWLTLAFKP
jgi:parallel beta-helix repeat protein